MLKDLDAVFGAIDAWATQHPMLGFMVMGMLGGVVAVLRMYERVGMAFTWAGFFARIFVKSVMGGFVAMAAFFGWRAMGWNMDWGYLVASICGVGGSDIIEAAVVLAIEFARKRLGLTVGGSSQPNEAVENGKG